jgi:predicted Na+-dependent transporter
VSIFGVVVSHTTGFLIGGCVFFCNSFISHQLFFICCITALYQSNIFISLSGGIVPFSICFITLSNTCLVLALYGKYFGKVLGIQVTL